MKRILFHLLFFIGLSSSALAQKFVVELKNEVMEVYDFQEIKVSLKKPDSRLNPFQDVTLKAIFTNEQQQPMTVEGFCDAQQGGLYKVRFMPTLSGKYTFRLTFSEKNVPYQFNGSFTVIPSRRSGPLRVDKENPRHFVYEHTGGHFFWNSTTAYWLLGWKDEAIIYSALDRLAKYGINRVRVAINGRAHGGERWSEPTVVESDKFSFMLNPWLAGKPNDLDAPEFDVTRFNVSHWQKLDRLVLYAREKGIIVSLIFYVDGLDHGCDPFKKTAMGNENEQMYYRYAAARYGGFENIMWDIANEYHLFRTPEWAEKMGNYLKTVDHSNHLISVHGKADFPFRKSPWVDVVMYQSWDECGGYGFMSDCQRLQAESGRILPQVNEEYGYEDHYPVWGCGPTATKEPNGRSADNRRRLAWEICMTGSYQTTGESARFGTGAGEDTGGGWINGRGNDKMTMLAYYDHLKKTFEQTDYWLMQPCNQWVSYGNLCLANTGREYLVYSRLPHCRVILPRGLTFSVTMVNPRTGEKTLLPDCNSSENGAWQYPGELNDDWVFIIKKKM